MTGKRLNALTDPLRRTLQTNPAFKRRCDMCSWPLFDFENVDVFRFDGPNGPEHLYVCPSHAKAIQARIDGGQNKRLEAFA